MPHWELLDEDELMSELLEARPELAADLAAWVDRFRVNPYDLPKTLPAGPGRAMGMMLGWWYPVRPFLFEIVLDEAHFGELTAIKRLPTDLWDAATTPSYADDLSED